MITAQMSTRSYSGFLDRVIALSKIPRAAPRTSEILALAESAHPLQEAERILIERRVRLSPEAVMKRHLGIA